MPEIIYLKLFKVSNKALTYHHCLKSNHLGYISPISLSVRSILGFNHLLREISALYLLDAPLAHQPLANYVCLLFSAVQYVVSEGFYSCTAENDAMRQVQVVKKNKKTTDNMIKWRFITAPLSHGLFILKLLFDRF